jgi:hypothetical protein
MELTIANNVPPPNVFIDGLPRSGKSSLCQIIVSLKHSEHIDMATNLEYILMGRVFNKINNDFAKTYLRTFFNQSAYNKLIGRGVNFRPTDFTGIPNFRDPKIYYKRLKIFSYGKKKYHHKKTHIRVKLKSDPALSALKNKYFFFPFQSHQLLCNFKEFKKLDLNYKIIEFLRNPIETTYSLASRGLLEGNAKKDPRKLNLDILYNKKSLPWFVHGYAKEYCEANKFEKSALVVINEIKKIIKNKRLIKKLLGKRILLIKFEDFVTNTNLEMKKISKFLNTSFTKSTKNYIREANCPRKIDNKISEKKFNFLKKKIKNKKIFTQLVALENDYKNNFYSLKK